MLVNVIKCIVCALKTKSKERLTKPRHHWLDYADQKYGKRLVSEVKGLLKIIVLYIPFAIFWALFDQQSSRWTFQAVQMNGFVTKNFSIKPDQMQVVNPLAIVCFIPLFSWVIYPALAKIGIKSPLQKLGLGMALSGVAFVVSGLLELNLQRTYAVAPREGEGQLRLFNGRSCSYSIETNLPHHANIILAANSQWTEKHIALNIANESMSSFQYNISIIDGGTSNCQLKATAGEFEVLSANAQSYFLTSTGDIVPFIDSPLKSKSTLPLVRILMTSDYFDPTANISATGVVERKITFQNAEHINDGRDFEFLSDIKRSHEIDPATYFIWINGTKVGAVELQQGGSYTIVINQMSVNHYVSSNYEYKIGEHRLQFIFYLFDSQQTYIQRLSQTLFTCSGKCRSTWLWRPAR